MEDDSYQTGWTEKSAERTLAVTWFHLQKVHHQWISAKSTVVAQRWIQGWEVHGEYRLQEIHGHLTCNIFSTVVSSVIENWSTLSNYNPKLVIMTINSLRARRLAHTTSKHVFRSRWPSQLARNGKHLAVRILQASHLCNDKQKRRTCWGR